MRFRTNEGSFGVKKNFLGKAPASSFQAFSFGQGQRLVLAEKTQARAQSFNVPNDLTIHFQLNPDGSLPKIASVGQRLIRNVTQGGQHAYQNRRDLQTLVTALFNEGLTQTQLAHKIDLAKALPSALRRLSEMSPAVKNILNDYEVSAHKVRLMASEDPRLAPGGIFDGPHVHSNLPDTFIQKGAWVQMPDGELRFAGFGNTMSAFARDADGDFMLLFHFASKTGGKSYALGHKLPGYKRNGIFEVEKEFDLSSVLKHAEKQIFRSTAEGFKGVLDTHKVSGLGAETLLQRIQHRTALSRKIRGERGFQGLTPEEQEEFRELTLSQLTATSDTGRQHTKVVYKELFEAWGEALDKGEMTVSELNDFLAGKMNLGDFRFQQLELKILKSAKNGGAAQELHATNLEEFRMVLTDAANFGIMGYKKLGKMSATDKVKMLAAIVGEGGMSGLSDLNSDAFKKIEEAFMYPLAAGLKRMENPFVESLHRSGVQKRLAGQRTFFEAGTNQGIFETMVDTGLYDIKPILTPQEFIAPELQQHFQGLSAVFQRGFEGELYSPVGGYGTELPGGAKVINTPILRTGVVVNVGKNQTQVLSGQELARRYLNNTVSDKFKFKYNDQTHEVRFGRAEGLFARSNVATDEKLAARLADGFLVDSPTGKSLDSVFTHMNSPSLDARRAAMARYIQHIAATGTEEEYRNILARSHSLMKGGKEVAKRFQTQLKDVSVLLGPDQDVIVGRSGQARFGSPEVSRALANRISVLLPHDTNDPTEFSEAFAILQRNLRIHIADYAAKIKGGVGTVVEAGTESGQLWRGAGAFGSPAKRAGKITTQFQQSVMVRNQTLGYVNIDTTALIQSDVRFAHLSPDEIADKYLNNGDKMSARYKQFGEGSAFLTDEGSRSITTARDGSPIPGIKLRHTPTPEEIETRGLISKMERDPSGVNREVYYQPAFNGDFRDFTKVVDEFGEWKIEPTRVKGARTTGGEILHGIMPLGEAYGKTEGGLLGLISNMADQQGMSRGEIIGLIQEIQQEESSILAMKNVLKPAQMQERLDQMLESKLLRVGFTREMVEIVDDAGEKSVAEMVIRRGVTLGAVMSSVERPKNLEASSHIQLGSATGQELTEQTSANVLQFLGLEADIRGKSLVTADGQQITKAMFADLLKEEEVNQALKTAGLENISAASVFRGMVEASNPVVSEAMGAAAKRQYAGAAQRMGQQVAAAESIGGIAMQKTAEHLNSLVGRMAEQAKGAPLAVIAGAALLITGLQSHHEKERKRHRPFLPR